MINAILQPEEFIEIGEALAQEKGMEQGGWVRLSSKRGVMVCKAEDAVSARDMSVDPFADDLATLALNTFASPRLGGPPRT